MYALRIMLIAACAALSSTGRLAIAAEPQGSDNPPQGNASVGEALYVGATRLANGGAPCLACHGIAGHGLAHAASFGPDLTGSFDSFGSDGLEGALADVPFPSMQPIYNTHALTPAERAHIIAFLGSTGSTAVPAHLGMRFAAAVAVAFCVLGAAFVIVGRRGGRRTLPSSARS